MIIKKLKINNFGNLKKKEINLNNKINIIYGENESGKSTLLKCIIGILYGISKNKRGKEISDYDYYKPWYGEEYSGKIIYELDNKKEYEIYRDFNKKNVQIFNEGKDISKEFNIDKNKGNEFFYEQTKIDEELFLSTQILMQEQTKLNKEKENILIQKISNLISTGEDNTSFKKIIEKLNKLLIEEIGTDRTTERPINLILNKLDLLKKEKEKLLNNKNKKQEINEKIITNKIENNKIENKIKLIKEIKKINEENNLEIERIKINKKTNEENNEKIIKLKQKIKEIKKNTEKINGKKRKIFLISTLFIINIINFILIKSSFVKIRNILVVPNVFCNN